MTMAQPRRLKDIVFIGGPWSGKSMIDAGLGPEFFVPVRREGEIQIAERGPNMRIPVEVHIYERCEIGTRDIPMAVYMHRGTRNL